MHNYRWDSVEITSDRTIPLIVACPQSALDGVVLTPVDPPESRRVREINGEALDLFVDNGPKFMERYGSVPENESHRLLGLVRLIDAWKHRERVALENAIQQIVTSCAGPMRDFNKEAMLRNPGNQLGTHLANGLRDVRLVMWRKDDGKETEILPGLHCQDATSALYALVAMRLSGGHGLGACLHCGNPIVRKRGTRKFCSDACRYAMFERRRATKRKK